jgi:hypothetical protein
MSMIFSLNTSQLNALASDSMAGRIRGIALSPNTISFQVKERKFTRKWIKVSCEITKFDKGDLTIKVDSGNFFFQIGRLLGGEKIKRKLRAKLGKYNLNLYLQMWGRKMYRLRLGLFLDPWLSIFGVKLTGFSIDGKNLKIEIG